MDKETRKNKIVELIINHPRSWSELMQEIEVSEPTLSRYLTELKESGKIARTIDSQDQVKYVPGPDLKGVTIQQLIEAAEAKNDVISNLDDRGLFSGGMTAPDIRAFFEWLSENPDKAEKIGFAQHELFSDPLFDTSEGLNSAWLMRFCSLLVTLNNPDTPVTANIELSIDAEDCKTDLSHYEEWLEKMEEA